MGRPAKPRTIFLSRVAVMAREGGVFFNDMLARDPFGAVSPVICWIYASLLSHKEVNFPDDKTF